MLRSIHAVFSCTCMRWVSRSADGSSCARSTTGYTDRAGIGKQPGQAADDLGAVGLVDTNFDVVTAAHDVVSLG